MLVASRNFANDATFEIKVRGVLLVLTFLQVPFDIQFYPWNRTFDIFAFIFYHFLSSVLESKVQRRLAKIYTSYLAACWCLG